jgi:signal transduction histidine kinase
MASDDEKECSKLPEEIRAAKREINKLTAQSDQLQAELRDAIDTLRRGGVSEEEIERMLAEEDEGDGTEGTDTQ